MVMVPGVNPFEVVGRGRFRNLCNRRDGDWMGIEERYIVKGTLHRASVPWACGGLIVEDGVVIEAAPIFKWAKGCKLEHVTKWIETKGGSVERV